MATAAPRRTPIGPILMIVGGALLAIGSFLAWAKVTGGGTSVTASGIDGSDGYITLAAGAVALAAGIASLRAGRRALAILAILAGLVGGALGVYDAITAEDSVLDSAAEEIAPTAGGSVEEVRILLNELIDAGQLGISISIGLYVVIAGGLIALVGGVLQASAVARGAGAPSMPSSAPMGSPPPPSTMPPPSAPPAGPPPPEAPST